MSLLRLTCHKVKKCFLLRAYYKNSLLSRGLPFLGNLFYKPIEGINQVSRTWVLGWCLVSIRKEKHKTLLNKRERE